MLVAPHIAAGVTLGLVLKQPALIVPLAVASHFLLDCIPHWQETMAPYKPTWKTYLRIPIDFGLGALIIWLAVQTHPELGWSIGLGAFFAAIPDIDVATVAFPKLKNKIVTAYWDWHCKIQREVESWSGVVTQLVVLAIGFSTVFVVT